MGHWWLLVSNPATHLPRHQLTRRDAGHSPKMLCPKLVSAPCLVLFVVQIFFSIWARVMTHENRSNVQRFYKWREFRPQIVPVNSRSGRRQWEFLYLWNACDFIYYSGMEIYSTIILLQTNGLSICSLAGSQTISKPSTII